MLEINEELKNLYRTDYFPARDTQLKKELKLYFPELGKTITNEKIYTESMKLTESICSESDLTLGGCESTEFAITVAGVGDEVVGKKMIVTQTVDGRFDMPLGTYRVKAAKKKDDLDFKEVLAYDRIADTDTNVSTWYNALSWPQTVKSMRISLLTYLGIEIEEQNLTNDMVSLEKTISPGQLLGRTVLKKLCEINAGFGRMERNGKFRVVQLSGLGLYPSETLYPAEDLFPAESGEYVTSGYIKTAFEEYIVEPITAVTIREDDEDTGVTEGTLENPYVISDNFLLYGKSSAELHAIAANILLQLKNKFYRPHSTTMIGLPYMLPGDTTTIITGNDAIETFMFHRVLTGIQVLRDEITAPGNQKRRQTSNPNEEIQQLKSKTLKIKKEVDQLSISMTDMEAGLQSQITQTAGQLQSQIDDTANGLQSQIIQTAEQLQTQVTDNKNAAESQFIQQATEIGLKVGKDGVIAAINLTPEEAKIAASKINLSGYVEITSLTTPGAVTIDGGNIKANSLNANAIKAGILQSMRIENDEIYLDGSTIQFYSGGAIKRSSSNNWSSTSRSLDNVLSFTSQAIQIGQYSGNLNNTLNIPMQQINIGYTGSYSYSKIYHYGDVRFYQSSSAYISIVDYALTAYGNLMDLGTASVPWDELYINSIFHKSGGKLGFYGATPTVKTSISQLSTSATLADVINKINSMISNSHGIW